MVKSLDRKLARDLWSLKTQVVSIALVIACGIGGFIGSFSTYGSLLASRDQYYAAARLPLRRITRVISSGASNRTGGPQ